MASYGKFVASSILLLESIRRGKKNQLIPPNLYGSFGILNCVLTLLKFNFLDPNICTFLCVLKTKNGSGYFQVIFSYSG